MNVMLSEALQRNTKHEARLSNISIISLDADDRTTIRDSSTSLGMTEGNQGVTASELSI